MQCFMTQRHMEALRIVSGVVYTNIYSARSTIEYCLQLNYELIFVPISVELVLG